MVSILSARNEYEVSSKKLNSAHKVDQLNGNGPEVFILDEADLAANINVLVELVDHYPRMRLIVLGLEDNLLHIFNQQIVQVEQVSDFLEQL